MGRVIVFTQFRATQQQILDRLVSEGYTVHAFHGGHSSSEKEQIVEDFEEEGGILVSTDAMSEGRNLPVLQYISQFRLAVESDAC